MLWLVLPTELVTPQIVLYYSASVFQAPCQRMSIVLDNQGFLQPCVLAYGSILTAVASLAHKNITVVCSKDVRSRQLEKRNLNK